MASSYGSILIMEDFLGDYHFKWCNEEGAEVYGWTERAGEIIKGSSGWFRTTDPKKAAVIARSNLDG